MSNGAKSRVVPVAILTCMVLTGVWAVGQDRQATSAWAYPGPGGKLGYKTTPAGDRIMDFSHAGYMGGGVALPNVPVKVTVQPSGGTDDTAVIQEAIDKVSAMGLINGFRGAVLLAPGTFTCSRTISIAASGVVLRGSGSGSGGTTIKMVGDRHSAISVGRPRGAGQAPAGQQPAAFQTSVTDAYVPSGATAFTVADGSGFAAGDRISIRRPVTPAWIKFMQMHDLVRSGKPQTWLAPSREFVMERTISAISGSRITVDVQLSDSLDARHLNPPGTTVSKLGPAVALTQIGVESLRIQAPAMEVSYGQSPYSALRLGCDDCWAKDILSEETMNSFSLSGNRITMQRVVGTHTYANLGASKPADFAIEGGQNLMDRCQITGDNTYFVCTRSTRPGPNVLLNCTFRGRGSRVQPHERWATGLLIDNCTVPDGGIDYPNRGIAGSGHGWTMGWGVVWNSVADFFIIQNPPGAPNWAIGNIGRRVLTARYFDRSPMLPEGIFESHGTPVAPQSLYLAQLAERLGPQALKNIGYASNTASVFTNKTVPRLPAWSDVDPVHGPDLAFRKPVDSSNFRKRAREFGAEKVLDGDDRTYWATDDGITKATLEVDTDGPIDFNTLVLSEAAGLSGRVQEYKVEGYVNSEYVLLSQGTTIGERKLDRFPRTIAWKVRLTILRSQGYPAIRKFGLYLDTAAAAASGGGQK